MNKVDATIPPLLRAETLDLLDWDEVHNSIQLILAALDSKVANSSPGVTIKPGRNSARAWDLFSYRVYQSAAAAEIDPVVVGIVCSRTDRGFVIHGDIAGETRGDILFEVTDREAIGKPAVIDATHDTAELLAKQSEIVAAAVANGNRRAD